MLQQAGFAGARRQGKISGPASHAVRGQPCRVKRRVGRQLANLGRVLGLDLRALQIEAVDAVCLLSPTSPPLGPRTPEGREPQKGSKQERTVDSR